MKDAVEGAHMGHPDFRANGRIFATLHADLQWGMVKLTPDQQRMFVRDAPAAFTPSPARGDGRAAPPCGWTQSTRRRSARR
jgi:hypothetical protein